MPGFEFPRSPFRPEELTDWLEMQAINAADGDASAGDLERDLKRLNCEGTQAEGLIGSVFLEVERREKASGADAYPFEREPSSIKLKKTASDYPAYIFCLALSYCRWKPRKGARENPWLLFEQLAAFSAKAYLGGEVEVFGTSTRDNTRGKKRFIESVNRLAKKLGEGQGFKPQKTFSTKDGKLDVVAWKPFPDGLASQVILFGQCAGGSNWTHKLTELDPDAFWDQWMSRGKVSQPLRTLFMPHRVHDVQEWEKHGRSARLLFDRCRIAAFAHRETKRGAFANKLLRCCRAEWKISV
jgi:hypothetical protein